MESLFLLILTQWKYLCKKNMGYEKKPGAPADKHSQMMRKKIAISFYFKNKHREDDF